MSILNVPLHRYHCCTFYTTYFIQQIHTYIHTAWRFHCQKSIVTWGLCTLWYNLCVLCIRASHGTICADASCWSRQKSPHRKAPCITVYVSQFVLNFCNCTIVKSSSICAREPTLKSLLLGCKLLQGSSSCEKLLAQLFLDLC